MKNPRSLIVLLGALALACFAKTAFAQEVRGTVRDSATRQPIPGAVLVLLDASGGALGRNITNERGQYRIARSAGMTRMRVLRIGFRPREVELPRATDSVAQLDISMQSLPTMLEPIRVSADSKCPRRSDDARTYALLEQVRAGLLSIVVARDANPAALVRLVFERRMDGSSDRIATQSVRMDSITAATTSFSAAHAATDFVQRGFMRDSAQQSIFFGPDADVLLDDGFALGYCFRIIQAGRERTNQIGLAFSAPERPSGRVDIDGALWVDTIARALRDIEFRYVGLGRLIEGLRPGGRVAFREMPNGMVLIDQWSLRLIATEQDTIQTGAREQIRTWYRASEKGGEVAHARWPDGSAWHGSLGTLRLRAVTSEGGPAPGTSVRLVDTPYQGVTDSAGIIEISDLVPGPYSLAIIDPRLASIAVDVPTPVKFVAVRDSTVQAGIIARTANDFTIDRCVADKRFAVGGAVRMIGRAMRPNGEPVGGIKISLAEIVPGAAAVKLPQSYTTGADGIFQFCPNFRRGMKILVGAYRDGSLLRDTTVRLDDTLTVVRMTIDARP